MPDTSDRQNEATENWTADYTAQTMDSANFSRIEDSERVTVIAERDASGRYIASTMTVAEYIDSER